MSRIVTGVEACAFCHGGQPLCKIVADLVGLKHRFDNKIGCSGLCAMWEQAGQEVPRVVKGVEASCQGAWNDLAG